MPSPTEISLSASPLSVAHVEAVARAHTRVSLSPQALDNLARSRAALEAELARGHAIYGVNTGFGSLSQTRIPDDQLKDVQRNLLRSHAAGVGEPLPTDVVRAMLLLLAASLSRGHSGVRPETARAVVDLLNAGITPVVPGVGSVGASGDLAPLAHACLVLIGEGHATISSPIEPGAQATGANALPRSSNPSPHGGEDVRAQRGQERGRPALEILPGAVALQRANLKPIELTAKEGLALINGTHLMAAHGALLLADAARLVDAALAACAMSIDACRGTDAFLDPRVYAARNQPGPTHIAERLRALLDGSAIIPSHADNDPRVQDPYSLRCAPLVLGAAWDCLDYARAAVERELGAVTDNPLIFTSQASTSQNPPARAPHASSGQHSAPLLHVQQSIVSAGCFHGMPVAIPLDSLAIALSHIAGIAERRVYYILSASDSQNPVNPHLSPKPGLHSGLMIVQYTAAACVNEMIGLANPASVANIPTSAGMEDYNSFGPRAAAKARRALDLCTSVVAIELLTAAEALEYQRPLKSGAGVERAHALVRSVVPRLTADRPPAPDIAAIETMIRTGAFSAPA